MDYHSDQWFESEYADARRVRKLAVLAMLAGVDLVGLGWIISLFTDSALGLIASIPGGIVAGLGAVFLVTAWTERRSLDRQLDERSDRGYGLRW